MDIRRTSAADLPQLHAIFTHAMGALFRPHGFEPPTPPAEVFSAQQAHLLAHDAGRCFVAERDGEPVAFAAAWQRGRDWFLASLFVEPTAQSSGIGSALLEAVWGAEDLRRRTITDAIQPVSNALYARRGLIPATPLLDFEGAVRAAQAHARLEPTAPTADALLELDLAAYGFDRAVDHAFWGPVAECTLWLRDARPVAYAYRFPSGAIGPVAGASPDDAGAALACELARSAGGVARVRVPGSARALVAAALAAGLRLSPMPGLLLLGPGASPPDALAVASYTLL